MQKYYGDRKTKPLLSNHFLADVNILFVLARVFLGKHSFDFTPWVYKQRLLINFPCVSFETTHMAPKTPARHTCQICGRSSFNTAHALSRHLKQSFCGKALASGGSYIIDGQSTAGFVDTLPRCPPINQPKKRPLSRIETDEIIVNWRCELCRGSGDKCAHLSRYGFLSTSARRSVVV